MPPYLKVIRAVSLIYYIAYATAGSCISFAVDPGIDTTAPAVIVRDFSTGTLEASFVDLVTGDELSSTVIAPTQRIQRIPLPREQNHKYIEVLIRNAVRKPVFSWRTLVLPAAEKMIEYSGPTDLVPPDDFIEYWTRAKDELAKVPVNPRVTRLPDQDSTTGLLHKVELDSVNDTTFVGYLFVPRAAYRDGDPDKGVIKKHPVVILTPGYGGEQKPVDRTAQGYITFSTNPRNHGPSRAYWKSPVEHQLFNIENHEQYYYKLAILDCLRAAEFVFERPETDADAVGCEGSSQGGYLALATAALDKRVACVAANVIAFSDYPDGSILASVGGQVKVRELLETRTTDSETISKSLAYTDGANLATLVECPTLISMTGQDPVCPYVCGIVVLNKLPPKTLREFRIVPDAKHEVPPQIRRWNADWFNRWLMGRKS